MDQERIASCIEACNECAEACDYCADACLDEEDVADLVDCIRLNRDCADLCRLVATLLARGSSFTPSIVRACADACDACARECDEHPLEHCRACAEACRDCADEFRRMMEIDVPRPRGVATHA